jgi:hypothetical protein
MSPNLLRMLTILRAEMRGYPHADLPTQFTRSGRYRNTPARYVTRFPEAPSRWCGPTHL